MSERTNRRDQIVDAAATSFIKNGYTATSIRHIADEVGCTEAAIYYHFKDGKRALFREVVECHMPDPSHILDSCEQINSLQDLMVCFVGGMKRMLEQKIHRFRWIVSEFNKLDEEERALLHNKYLRFHDHLAAQISRFVHDERLASGMAWMMISTGFGYGQLFYNIDLKKKVDFEPDDLMDVLSWVFANRVEMD